MTRKHRQKNRRRHTVFSHSAKKISTPARTTAPVKFVFTDMDSTLGLFWAYYCPAIREYISEMHHAHGVAVVDLEREIGRVTQIFGTHEYAWLMEMTKFRREFKGTAAEFREQWVIPFWKHLDSNRHKYLRPFRDVMETLSELQRRGVTVVILSDAPYFMALTRAVDMNFAGAIKGLFALDCPLPALDSFVDPEDLTYGLQRITDLSNRHHDFTVTAKLEKAFEKPNPRGLLAAMEAFGAKIEDSLFVGDNLIKDGVVAQAVGMRFIWASYGLWVPAEYEDIIDRRITPTGELLTNGHGVGHRPEIYPPMVAEAVSYKTVLDHLCAEGLGRPAKLNPSANPAVTKGSGH